MEIINTKPGYKINCTGPQCTLGATQPAVSHKYDWDYVAIWTTTFSD